MPSGDLSLSWLRTAAWRLRRAPAAVGRSALLGVAPAALAAATLWGCALFDRDRQTTFRRVLPPVAFEMLRDTPDLLILDLRQPEEFHGALGHIFHSRNIPLPQLPFRLAELSGYRDRTFLVYCRRDDECGPTGMAILASSGFHNAVLLDGGIQRWIADGFGTVGEQIVTPPQPAETGSTTEGA